MTLNNDNKNECCKCTTPQYEITLNQQGPQGRQGNPGEDGKDGVSPIVNVVTNTNDTYVLQIDSANGTIITPNLKATLPPGGNEGNLLAKNSSDTGDVSWINGNAKFVTLTGNQEIEGEKTFTDDIHLGINAVLRGPDNEVILGLPANDLLQIGGPTFTTLELNTRNTGKVIINKIDPITDVPRGYNVLHQGNVTAGDNIQITNTEEGISISGSAAYTLPQANATTLGGIKANAKQDTDTQEVRIDSATGLLYTKAGGGVTDAYTKAETDELLDAKQDILTPVQPLTIQNKIISNLEGMNYTSDGQGLYATDINACAGVYNNAGYGTLGDNICLCKQPGYSSTDWGDNVIPSKIIIPYTFGQIVKFPYRYNNNPGFAFWGYNSSINCHYPIFNPREEDKVSVQTVGTFLNEFGFTFGRTSTATTGTADTVPNASNIAYAQLIRNTSSFTLVVFYPQFGTENLVRAKYEITNNFSKLNEITSFIITPTTNFIVGGENFGTSESNPIPISSIGLYEYSEDFSILENPESVLTDNLFDLSGQTAKNYLEVQVDGTTITTNSSGKLQANIPSNLTTQGNTFNGANQLVQLDSSGKLPALDGSQLTNLPGGTVPSNMVTTDTYQTITGIKLFDANYIKFNNDITFIENINNRNVLELSTSNVTIPMNVSFNIESNSITLNSYNIATKAIMQKQNDDYGLRFSVNSDTYFLGTVNPSFSDAKQIVTTADTNGVKFWKGTQTEYDGIAVKDANTMYIITE